MSLRSRIARLEARIDRIRSAEPEAPIDPTADAEWMALARALGPDHMREFAEANPEFRESLASTIAALEEWEATIPRWWLEGPWGQRRWRYGVRRLSDGGDDGA